MILSAGFQGSLGSIDIGADSTMYIGCESTPGGPASRSRKGCVDIGKLQYGISLLPTDAAACRPR